MESKPVSERAPTGNGNSLRGELLSFIASCRFGLPSNFEDNTALISSGFFDSLALFNLAIWIETKIGRKLDPASVDIVRQWDSVGKILEYINQELIGDLPRRMEASGLLAQPTAGPGYEIRTYRPEHKNEIADFQTGLWSTDPALNRRYFEWKYENNPYTDEINIYLAFYDDALVGMRGFYASRWETGTPARQHDVLVADDLLVREDHRHQALTTRIMYAAFNGLRSSKTRFLFNLSGGPLTVMGSLTTGWRSVGTMEPLRHVSSAARLHSALRRGLGRIPYLRRYAHSSIFHAATELNPFVRLDRLKTPFMTPNGPPIDIEKRPRSKEMASLIERIGHDGRLRHVRDAAYFNWRFHNPLHEYRFLFAGTDRLDGYLVLQRAINRPNPSPRVNIVDLEAINDCVQSALLRAALTAGDFAELVIWTATANEKLLSQLRALRFAPVGRGRSAIEFPCFLVRPIEDERLNEDWLLGDTRLFDLKNWDIRMIYSMAG